MRCAVSPSAGRRTGASLSSTVTPSSIEGEHHLLGRRLDLLYRPLREPRRHDDVEDGEADQDPEDRQERVLDREPERRRLDRRRNAGLGVSADEEPPGAFGGGPEPPHETERQQPAERADADRTPERAEE